MRWHVLIFLVFLWGCSVKPPGSLVTVNVFPVQGKLLADSVIIPPQALYPDNLFITRNKLIMYTEEKDTVFDVYELPECRYLYSAGIKGRGDQEFLNLDRRFFYPTDRGFKVLFAASRFLKEVVVHTNGLELLSGGILLRTDGPVNNLMLFNDSVYCSLGGVASDHVFCVFHMNTGEKIHFGSYPEWSKKGMTPLEKMFLYIHTDVVKPDGKKMAVFYQYFKRLRIYRTDGKLEKEIDLRTPPYTKNTEESVLERMVYYDAFPYATDKYIFVFCRNHTKRDPERKNTELQIWKWDGTPVGSYNLDRSLSVFTISPEYAKLYAVDGINEDKIYVYPLDILK